MFTSELQTLKKRTEAIRTIISFRAALSDYFPSEREWAGAKLQALLKKVPDSQEWKVFDHTACFSSLYTAYESYIHNIIARAIADYQSFESYADLPDSLKVQHRIGIANITTKIDFSRYSHFSINALAEELHGCLNTSDKHSITPETIYMHENNINMQQLADLLNRINYRGIVPWLDRSPIILSILSDSRSSQARITSLLKEFVERRNDCNHGEADEILGRDQLLFFCDFVDAICEAIYEFSHNALIGLNIDRGVQNVCGTVTEIFSDNVSVLVASSGTFEVGKYIVCMGDGFCKKIKIESMRLDDVACSSFSVISELELGLVTSVKLKKNVQVVCV